VPLICRSVTQICKNRDQGRFLNENDPCLCASCVLALPFRSAWARSLRNLCPRLLQLSLQTRDIFTEPLPEHSPLWLQSPRLAEAYFEIGSLPNPHPLRTMDFPNPH